MAKMKSGMKGTGTKTIKKGPIRTPFTKHIVSGGR